MDIITTIEQAIEVSEKKAKASFDCLQKKVNHPRKNWTLEDCFIYYMNAACSSLYDFKNDEEKVKRDFAQMSFHNKLRYEN